MPKKVPKDKDSSEQPKIVIDDAGEPNAKPSGISFLAGLLLVVLVVAAIGSFSIIAMELGEIKRLVGLKESTGKQIDENENQITKLKSEISKFIEEKSIAEQESLKARQEADGYKRVAKELKDRDKAWRDAVEENNSTNERLLAENSNLVKEITELNENLSNLKTKQSILQDQINDLDKEKKALNKYTQQVESEKANLDRINAAKSLSEEAKAKAEEETIRLVAQIAILEKKKNDVLSQKIKNEELANAASKALDEAVARLSVVKGEAKAAIEIKSASESKQSELIRENSRLQSERDSLSAEILKLNQDYGKKISEYQDAYRKWDAAVKAKRNESQGQSNQ